MHSPWGQSQPSRSPQRPGFARLTVACPLELESRGFQLALLQHLLCAEQPTRSLHTASHLKRLALTVGKSMKANTDLLTR